MPADLREELARLSRDYEKGPERTGRSRDRTNLKTGCWKDGRGGRKTGSRLSKQEKRIKKGTGEALAGGPVLGVARPGGKGKSPPRLRPRRTGSLEQPDQEGRPTSRQPSGVLVPSPERQKIPLFTRFSMPPIPAGLCCRKRGAGELAALRNLTFPAESLRQKALSWKDESLPGKKNQGPLRRLCDSTRKSDPQALSNPVLIRGGEFAGRGCSRPWNPNLRACAG